MKKMRKGFTLVELLIVVAIIGILSAMMMLSVSDSTNRATANKIVADLRSIGSAVGVYISASGDESTAKWFTGKSPDYVVVGNLGSYKVTSDSNGKWYAEYSGTVTVDVEKLLKVISEDRGLVSETKMRIQ